MFQQNYCWIFPFKQFYFRCYFGERTYCFRFAQSCFSAPIIWFSLGPFKINSTKIITFELVSCLSHWPFIIIKCVFFYPTWFLASSVRFGVIQLQKQQFWSWESKQRQGGEEEKKVTSTVQLSVPETFPRTFCHKIKNPVLPEEKLSTSPYPLQETVVVDN